ncbi:HNH endonuclease [Planktotalea lamellibrachiae]|nr:HNH endonuclease [Aliiroseovarius lamellibrachiae]
MMNAMTHMRTLVLNADMQPLSYAPLSIWSWQSALVAVLQDRVIEVRTYEDVVVHSATQAFEVPSVIALKRYRKRKNVSFTRYNVFLRDEFRCQYCGEQFDIRDLTFDHVVPRSKNGGSNWHNIATCCGADNVRKANRTPEQAGMKLRRAPYEPTAHELDAVARRLPHPRERLHRTWMDFLYWDTELEG